MQILSGYICTAFILVLLAKGAPAFADSTTTTERTVTKLAEGVYAIRHKDSPDTFPQGNTTVVIGDHEVLVVDSCYLPSSAREDIAEISKWTNKPVHYLLNTHWHYDHTMGNAAYAEAFPNLTIIAQAETLKGMRGHNPGWLAGFPTRADRFKELLVQGKSANGKPYTEGEKRELETAMRGVGKVQEEFKNIADRLPNLTFDHELNIDLGNREVLVRFLGRGNTDGDAVVYLPKDKILVAGDLLDHPVPYLGGGYPSEEVATLKRMALLDATTIVPGHGDVLHDKAYLHQVINFINTVVTAVQEETFRTSGTGMTAEKMQKYIENTLDLKTWRQQFAGNVPDDIDFFNDFALSGLVKASYEEASKR